MGEGGRFRFGAHLGFFGGWVDFIVGARVGDEFFHILHRQMRAHEGMQLRLVVCELLPVLHMEGKVRWRAAHKKKGGQEAAMVGGDGAA